MTFSKILLEVLISLVGSLLATLILRILGL